MDNDDRSYFAADKFSGRVRLFPLPNLVVFPGIHQPLHIFEPRYKALLEEAAGDDRLIAMATLIPGWEKDYEGRPPIYSVACLCQLVAHQPTAQGTYNVIVLGLRRAQIIDELPPAKLFREARAAVLDDTNVGQGGPDDRQLQQRLIDACLRMLPRAVDVKQSIERSGLEKLPLGALTDLIAYGGDFSPKFKRQMLEEQNVDQRARLLVHQLTARSASTRGEEIETPAFPPRFSAN